MSYKKYIFTGAAFLCIAIAGWLLYPASPGGTGEVGSSDSTPSQSTPVTASFTTTQDAAEIPTEAGTALESPTATGQTRLLQVSIKGMVMYPGEYYLLPGSTVADAINLAGGLLDGADTSQLDMDAQVYDNQYIGIP